MTIRCIRCGNEFDASAKVCPNCGEPLTDFLRKYLREPIDGKYEIMERLGVGGMGEVYKVRHTFLGATRVIKVIRGNIAGSADGKERFIREARLATRVQHPNVATLHDFSELPDGSQYMVWEYIDGQNLAQRIRANGKLSPRQAVRIAIQTLHGLEAIHRAGIVHRDISPENIMLTREDARVKIIDLGVAKAEGDGSTQAGMFIGKLRYASPEHLGLLSETEHIDGRADLYSLAVVLYEMLDGRPPFEATSPHDYLLIHSKETQFRPLGLPAELPGSTDLQGVMKRALERDREKRYATAADFASVLEAVEKTLPGPLDTTIETEMPVAASPKTQSAPYRVTEPAAATAIQTAADDKLVAPKTIMEPKKQLPLAVLGSIIGALVLAIIILVVVLLTRSSKTSTTVAETNTVATTSTEATTTVDVAPPATTDTTPTVEPVVETTATTETAAVTPTETVAPVTQTVAPVTQTVAPKTKRPKKVVPAPAPAPVPVTDTTPPPPPPPAPVTVVRFVEGGDDSTNESAIAATKRELGSVSQIAIRGSGGDADLTTKLVNVVKGQVSVSDSANVVIEFNGHIERRGFGRKTRSGSATISKGGQVLLRYEMPAENYRTGDDPAEAFARVLLQVLGK